MARLARPTSFCLNPAVATDLRVHLSRVEGHIRGIKGILDNKADCQGVLVQVSAIRVALNQVAIEVVGCHLDRCIAACAASGDNKALRQLQNMVANSLNA